MSETTHAPRIFISAVSREFGTQRGQLARWLERAGWHVELQEKLRQGDGTLLDNLETCIRSCTAIVHLVGKGYGVEPTPEELAGNRGPDERSARSYTQWEYCFAVQHGIKRHVYVARPEAVREPNFVASEEERERQRRHLAAIEQSGEHRTEFADPVELNNLVLTDVLGGPTAERLLRRPSNLDASIGTLFKGREAFLQRLRESLAGPDGRAAITGSQALHGLGGVGKTRLAHEYGHRFECEYTALLAVTADSPESLRRNLAGLTGPLVLNLPEQSAREEAVQAAAALRWLRENPGWFLIVDNVDTPEAAAEVEDLLKELSGGHVLITSRLTNWSAAVEALELDVLAETDAVAFLLERTAGRRRGEPDEAARAAELAGELAGLALALEQAAAFIRTRRLSFGRYLERWRTQREKVLEWFDERQMRYPHSVAVTWETSFAQLSEAGRNLLNLLCWFAPDPIPEWLLEGEHALEGIPDPEDALADLAAYSLVERYESEFAFDLHRLVQEVARQRLTRTGSAEGSLRQALRWINAAFEGDGADVRTWPTLDPLYRHAGAIAERADEAGLHGADLPTARLFGQLDVLLSAKADYAPAEQYSRRALAISETNYGLDHLEVAVRLNNLADLLRVTNRLPEAEPLYRRALAIDEAGCGPNHPRVATKLNNLATLLRATNRAEEAEPLFRRALTITEVSLGPHHPTVAIRLNNLAELLRLTNRLDEAEPLFLRGLAIFERSFGPDHPNVAAALNNLAVVLRNTDRTMKAEALFRRALAIDEASYGPDHPRVATRLNNLAEILCATNRFEEAEPLYRRALAIDEASYGLHHPDVATDLNNLAELLCATNRLEEAEPLYRRALAIDEASYGPNHPDVATDLNNLAELLRATHRHPDAESLFRRALAIDEASYGRGHPVVATCLNNLAGLMCATNRLAEAEPLLRRAVRILHHFKLQTGHQHPNFETTVNNYGGLLTGMGHTHEQATEMVKATLREVEAEFESGRGPERDD